MVASRSADHFSPTYTHTIQTPGVRRIITQDVFFKKEPPFIEVRVVCIRLYVSKRKGCGVLTKDGTLASRATPARPTPAALPGSSLFPFVGLWFLYDFGSVGLTDKIDMSHRVRSVR